mgnify:CR=1 FL=1
MTLVQLAFANAVRLGLAEARKGVASRISEQLAAQAA